MLGTPGGQAPAPSTAGLRVPHILSIGCGLHVLDRLKLPRLSR
jgi:hypothetical protein